MIADYDYVIRRTSLNIFSLKDIDDDFLVDTVYKISTPSLGGSYLVDNTSTI